jgi:nucleoside-diphosphate-sugar epimerase
LARVELGFVRRISMKIIVIGGSGLIGKKLVANLGKLGHDAVSASPSSGVNTVTGEGLAEALGAVMDDRGIAPGANPRLGPTRFDDWFVRNGTASVAQVH